MLRYRVSPAGRLHAATARSAAGWRPSRRMSISASGPRSVGRTGYLGITKQRLMTEASTARVDAAAVASRNDRARQPVSRLGAELGWWRGARRGCAVCLATVPWAAA
jgi:hypothetical protein